ncbi:VaFE repeat-containing surface-anchored protein [Enterococcus raffinosus]|uniref:VaFE repeat-containing surface-anchored protein n=1 Tax=Enterococcus raffinosus TaxID=71452 RepID=UPI00288CC647|nr:VaFE repeat-containing surface-anchored protein [Enterococcus raffinosus]MDT2555494.1 VaFE repeat-containing surface-anchored protein [Enterococcus raffinosus]
MKTKIGRILLSLFMIVTLLTQLIPINAITAYAESTTSTQVQKNEEKKKIVESTKDDPVESTSESSQESSETASSSESSKSSSVEKSDESEKEESEPKKENDLDGSVYGSGAGVPGDQVLIRSARALSPDLPTFFGISTEAITAELTAHQSDGFYLGTPYRGLYTNPDEDYCLSPNGAPTSYGPGMNCTGFVAEVIRRAGGDISRITNNSTGFGGAANAYNWRDVLRATTYSDTFNTVSEMLASGTMRKGDIIYFEPDVSVTNYDCHIGFFWGNTPSENKFWHSYYPDGNIISGVKTKSPAEKIYVFHNADVPKEGYVSLKKVNDKGDNMAGVSFKLTADGKSTTVKTDANGNLKSPNYTVGTVVEYEETATIDGHYIDSASSKGKITIKEGSNEIKVTNPRYANVTLNKKNDVGLNLEGVQFKLTYNGKDHTVKTDKNGQIQVTNELKNNTKIDWEETATIAGHYIDTANAKGSLVVKSGSNTINVTNPRYANLTLIKQDDKGLNLEGVEFNLHYNGKDHKVKTDKNGAIKITNDLKNNTKVEWEELKTIKGHYIDPENCKGSITVKSGENTINVNNPTLNFGMTSQASNQDGAQFVNPMKGQQLRDEVLIQANQAPKNAKLRLTSDFVEFGTGEQLGEESLKQVNEFEAKQAQFVKNIYLDFDATGMNGKKGVWINTLEFYNTSTEEWEEVARHDELTNEAEAIQFVAPEIHTEFFFYDQNEIETKLSDPLAKVKGFDRVFYKNLISGQTYTFDLTMMDRDSEKEFKDPNGQPIRGSITVVAGKEGTVTSTVNAKDYYENLAKEEAEKENEDNKEKEENKDTEDSKEPVQPKVAIQEVVDTETSEDIEEQEEATEFSTLNDVELLEGYVDVPFEANLSAANGKVLVAYEQLSTNDTPIAEEKKIDNEKQTGQVRNPKIGTQALINGKVEVTTDCKVTLTDKVAFEDLTPGVEYDQKVTWMDKRTKLPVMIDGKELTSTIKFTPKESSGTVTVTIEDVAVQQLFGKDSKIQLVAFEETTYNEEPVASEKDFDNEGQTITINKPVEPVKPTTPGSTLPQTSGSLGHSITWIILGLVLVVSAIFIVVNKKRQSNK